MAMVFDPSIKLVSADDHVQEDRNLWQDRLPARLRERAPRGVTRPDGYAAWAWGSNEPQIFGSNVWAGRDIPPGQDISLVRWEEIHPATYDAQERLRAMDQDHIQAAVLYPNFARAFIGIWLGGDHSDAELNLACIRAYNEWIAEFAQADPKRLIPIGIVPLDSVDNAVKEIEWMAKLGIRGALIPPMPSATEYWNEPEFEPLWAALSDANISINLHVGNIPAVQLKSGAHGAQEARFCLNRYLMGMPLMYILWSGIFDRYPNLKLVCVESDVGWIAYLKDRADWVFKNFEWRWHHPPTLKKHPSEYFGSHIMATFQEDRAGILARDLIGVDAICWATDFPHPETTWPRSLEFLAEQFEGVPEADIRKMVSENAARFYDIDLS